MLISTVSFKKRKIKIFLELIILSLLALTLARPQVISGEQEVETEGIELIIALDVSNSMLVEDMRPSRLDYAKREVHRLLDQLSGHKVGLVLFAGSSVLVSPLTPDYSSIRMFVDSASTTSVSTQGTNYQRAMEVAKQAFERGGVQEVENKSVSRAILFVSDGEDNEEGAIEYAQSLREEGIHIFSLAIGTESGGSIPIRDRFGYLQGYRKDRNDQIIVSRLETRLLKELAEKTQGAFYHGTFGSNHIAEIARDLSKLDSVAFSTTSLFDYEDYFQYLLAIALLLSLLELLISERNAKNKIWTGRFSLNNKEELL